MNFRLMMRDITRLLVPLIVTSLAISACSRKTDSSETKSENETMGLKLVGLNYTEIPIGDFYTDGTWGAAIPSRIGSASGTIICCVSLPKKWHPGLSVTVQWQDDNLYKKYPNALANRVLAVEHYEYISDGFLYVLFFPNDKIKVYASPWLPGFPDFPEGLQQPRESCPDHFTLKNSDPRCPAPDKRMKS